ncbi:MAG: hypothetical protein AAB785_01325 [Patescibacteria group bacterium]
MSESFRWDVFCWFAVTVPVAVMIYLRNLSLQSLVRDLEEVRRQRKQPRIYLASPQSALWLVILAITTTALAILALGPLQHLEVAGLGAGFARAVFGASVAIYLGNHFISLPYWWPDYHYPKKAGWVYWGNKVQFVQGSDLPLQCRAYAAFGYFVPARRHCQWRLDNFFLAEIRYHLEIEARKEMPLADFEAAIELIHSMTRRKLQNEALNPQDPFKWWDIGTLLKHHLDEVSPSPLIAGLTINVRQISLTFRIL